MSTTSSESLACPVIQPGKLSRRGATAFHAFVLMSFLAASAAPTPLYRVYQQEWGFSATLLTVVFGAYALALLTALLTAGRLSDHIGRRPVIALALLLQSVAMCGFLLASGPGWWSARACCKARPRACDGLGGRRAAGPAPRARRADQRHLAHDRHGGRRAGQHGAAGARARSAAYRLRAAARALPAGAGAAVARARDRRAATAPGPACVPASPCRRRPRRCSASRQPMSRYGCWAASTCR